MINDIRMRPRTDSNVSLVDDIMTELNIENIYMFNIQELNQIRDFYGEKMDKDFADGIYDSTNYYKYNIIIKIIQGEIFN